MKSRFVKFLICLVIVALIVCIYILVTRYVRRNLISDGPGMVYSFRDYELNGGDWQELWQEDGVVLSFEDEILRVIIGEDEIETNYTDDLQTVYQIGETVVIIPERKDLPFQCLLFHKEDIDGREVTFLTGFADLEAKEFVTEFVREDLEKLLPEGYYSEYVNRLDGK